MTTPDRPSDLIFGSNIVALVTPMTPNGQVSVPDVRSLVDHVISEGCDGIVVGGTTGEAPTLTSIEIHDLVATVVRRSAGRARVIAGVGTYDTADSVRRARGAENAGAHALLVVCPYYSKPPQAGLTLHCRAIADATNLPVMLYDVPARTGTSFDMDTLVELSQHPRIQAVKDAKGDLYEAMSVMSRTSLSYYCGIDELTLPYLAAGASGVVSVVGNIDARRNANLIQAVRVGDLDSARSIQSALLPLVDIIMRTSQGAIVAKAALHELGIIGHPSVRLPLVASTPDRPDWLAHSLAEAGL